MTLAVYLQIIGFDLVDIDDFAIAGDLHNRLNAGRHILLTFYRIPVNTLYWAPVSVFLYIMDIVLWGERANLYHCSNLLLHILSSLLIYVIFKKTSGQIWESALAAGLFAVHPVNANSVVVWGNRYTLVEALFALLTLFLYVNYAQKPHIKRYLLVLFSFTATLLSKSTAVYLPFLMLLIDFWPLKRFDPGGGRKYKQIFLHLVREKIPFFLIALFWLFFAVYFLRTGTYVGPYGLRYTNLLNLPYNAPVIYVGYLVKLAFPTHLPVPHLNFPMKAPLWMACCSTILILAITVFALRRFKSRPYLFFGWAWYLITVSPYALTLAFYNINIPTRYMYIPGIGCFALATWAASGILWGYGASKYLKVFLSSVFLLIFMAVSFVQSKKMADAHSYFLHTVKSRIRYGEYILAVDGRNAMAHHSVGTAYLRLGDRGKAAGHFRQALEIAPDDFASLNNLAGILADQGRLDEAIEYYKAALTVNPLLYQTHNSLAVVLSQKGEIDRAIAHLQKALEIKPDYQTAENNLKSLLGIKAQASHNRNSPTVPQENRGDRR